MISNEDIHQAGYSGQSGMHLCVREVNVRISTYEYNALVF